MSQVAVVPARRRRRGRTIGWIVLVVVVVLIACVVWVGIRAYLAKNDLQDAVGLAQTVETQISSDDAAGAKTTAAQLADKTHSAHDLTSDPIWRAAEIVPLAGPNLRAVRQVATVLASVSTNAIEPAASVISEVDLASFKPVDGAVNLAPLEKAEPTITAANRSLVVQLAAAKRIDTTKTISRVDSSVDQLVSVLGKATAEATSADQAVRLIPEMMGSTGPRNYLLLFQNNAELRGSGGNPGALALLHVEGGKISLTQQAASTDFPELTAPAVPLTDDTIGLFGAKTGEFMQDVTATPRFDVTAELAREMWRQKFGVTVDGVLSLDPIALSYILQATGPVTTPTGDTLTSDNVVSTLLSTTYARYPNPLDQNAFFAGAASSVFSAVSAGSFDPKALVTALAKAAGERRVLLWSATPSEESIITKTPLAGGLPTSTASRTVFGAYFNDQTGSKMDFYLTSSIGVGQAVCRQDGRPTWVVSITVTSTAPADAATSLPTYVTGGGVFGVPAGETDTAISVYAPDKAVFVGASQDGQTAPLLTAADAGRSVAQFVTKLKPGQSTTWKLEFLGGSNKVGSAPTLVHTPLVSEPTPTSVAVACGAPLG